MNSVKARKGKLTSFDPDIDEIIHVRVDLFRVKLKQVKLDSLLRGTRSQRLFRRLLQLIVIIEEVSCELVSQKTWQARSHIETTNVCQVWGYSVTDCSVYIVQTHTVPLSSYKEIIRIYKDLIKASVNDGRNVLTIKTVPRRIFRM